MDDIAELRAEAASVPVHGVWTRGGPVFSNLSDDTVRGLEARSIATFGDSATVGVWAFATGAWMTGLFQAGLLPVRDLTNLFPVLLVYAGLVLFVSGLFLFRRNNTFLASSFCSFGAFNLTRGVVLLCENRGLFPAGGVTDILQGVMFEAFAWIALSLLIGAVRMNVVLVLVWLCAFAGFALSGLWFINNSPAQGIWSQLGCVGGYFVLAAGTFAFYAGSAFLINTAWQRNVLPIGGKA
ncbi:MAG TPA: GPR1/FUN34/YaaH family transporter [Rhizomicrobium sp.]